MNDYDLKSFNILVVGPGKEYFSDLRNSEKKVFEEEELHFGVSEGFSTTEITQVLISIGSNVIAGLSVFYISKLFDKIFSAKSKAKKEGREFEINVSIQETIHIKNVESTIEIEKGIEIILVKKVGSKNG